MKKKRFALALENLMSLNLIQFSYSKMDEEIKIEYGYT